MSGLPGGPAPTATVAVTRAPSPSPVSSGSSNTGPYLVAAAIIALVGVVVTQVVQGRLSRRANKLTHASIEATRDIATRTAHRAEQDAARADTALFAKRYQDAATQLGHERAPVRLAGVYAMASLADDWPAQRQTCVSVLCAYLRMPMSEEENGSNFEEREVRQSIFAVMRDRLQRAEGPRSWSRMKFDLRWAALYGFDLTGAVFIEPPDFSLAGIFGDCLFERVHFENGGSFQALRFNENGSMRLLGVSIASGQLAITGGDIPAKAGLVVGIREIATGAIIHTGLCRVAGALSIHLQGQTESGGQVYAKNVKVQDGGRFSIFALPVPANLHTPYVDASDCIVKNGGQVDITGELLDAHRVTWRPEEVADGAVVDIDTHRWYPDLDPSGFRMPGRSEWR